MGRKGKNNNGEERRELEEDTVVFANMLSGHIHSNGPGMNSISNTKADHLDFQTKRGKLASNHTFIFVVRTKIVQNYLQEVTNEHTR